MPLSGTHSKCLSFFLNFSLHVLMPQRADFPSPIPWVLCESLPNESSSHQTPLFQLVIFLLLEFNVELSEMLSYLLIASYGSISAPKTTKPLRVGIMSNIHSIPLSQAKGRVFFLIIWSVECEGGLLIPKSLPSLCLFSLKQLIHSSGLRNGLSCSTIFS